MPVVACPACQSRYKLPDGTEGKKIKCPKCQGVIVVPAAAAPAASPPAASPPAPPPPAPKAPEPEPAPAPPAAPPPAEAPVTSPPESSLNGTLNSGLVEPSGLSATAPTRIKFLTGKLKNTEHVLTPDTVFGRDPSCTIVIPDGSLKQAAIKRLANGWIFKDLGGKNAVPILANEQRCVEKILLNGDKVRIGPLNFEFVQGKDPDGIAAPKLRPSQMAPEPGAEAAAPAAPAGEGPASPASPAEPPPLSTVRLLTRASSWAAGAAALLDRLLESYPRVDRAVLFPVERGADVGAPVSARGPMGKDLTDLPSETVVRKVFETRAPYVMSTQGGQQVFDLLASTAQQTQAVMALPLVYRGQLLGALYLDSRRDAAAFAAGDLARLSEPAASAALMLNELRLEGAIANYEARMSMYSHYMDLQLVERLESAGRAVQTRGEMKKLTVLFTDIRNFTAMSEKTEPQKLIAQMNQYFDSMVDAINRYDGYVNKYIGDSIMAFWGAPDARSIDSLQAVRAAMLMQRNLFFLNQDRAQDGLPPLYMGVGLHTGNAVVGNVGSAERKEYSALGDTVNTASRIQALTKNELPCSESHYRIFLSEATYAEVAEQVKAESLPPQQVKGKQQLVQVYSVQGISAMCHAEAEQRVVVSPYDAGFAGALLGDGKGFEGRAQGLSRVALRGTMGGALPPNAEVLLQLELDRGAKLEDVRARVIKMEPGAAGLDVEFRFDPLPSRKLRRLEDFLTALGRSA